MNVAWVTHRDIFNRAGGAEAADDDMIQKRPPGVNVCVVWPGGVSYDLEEFDRIVVAGVYGLSEHEVQILSKLDPIVWAHDTQFAGFWLYGEAKTFIALTPGHLDYEIDAHVRLKREKSVVNPGWFDTSHMLPVATKMKYALWAHRPEWHKGLHKAHKWADQMNVPLKVMIDKPHEDVLTAMKQAVYFVLLSDVYDAGPRAVMEAQLCECELVLENVGWFDEDPDTLRERIEQSYHEFWKVVLD